MGFYSLSIGRTALLTAKYGLDVTGQNIGNIDTPGYSRQKLNQEATRPLPVGNSAVIGSGVWTMSVTRAADEFVEKQLRQANSHDKYLEDMQHAYGNIQTFFGELGGNSLSDAMNKFWDSVSDFSTQVENVATRKTVTENAIGMQKRFNAISTQLREYRMNMNEEVIESTNQVNRLLEQVANLNREICRIELGGESRVVANDLRDQREQRLKELAELIDIDTAEEKNGSTIVTIHGRLMVYFDQTFKVELENSLSNGIMVAYPVFQQDKYPLNPLDGKLAAKINIRDEVIRGYQDNLDELAAKFIWETNKIHSQGKGLTAFEKITAVDAPIDPAVTLDKMQFYDKIMPGTFKVQNGNLELVIYNKNKNTEKTVNIEIDLDGRINPAGDPDMILWDPANPKANNALVNVLQKELDHAVPGAFKVSVDQEYKLSIESVSNEYGFAFGSDTSGILATLGINTFFTGHNAATMGVNKVNINDPSKMAGAETFKKGDNRNALNLLNLRDKNVFENENGTLFGYYQTVTGRLGSEASRTVSLKEMQGSITKRMFNQREELSGVNMDEEMTKMISYQRTYQGAAKFISTVDTLYDALLQM